MRVPINLASEPLENLRPLRAGITIAALAVLVLAGALLRREWSERIDFRSTTDQIARLELDVEALESEQQKLEGTLNTPDAQRIRERSAYLNSLIQQKSLSWTKMFMDLEEILPQQARITSIRPGRSDSQEAELNLTAVATTMQPLIEFVKNLESSSQFGSAHVGTLRYPGRAASGDHDIAIEVTTRYQQGPSEAPQPTARCNHRKVQRRSSPAPMRPRGSKTNMAFSSKTAGSIAASTATAQTTRSRVRSRTLLIALLALIPVLLLLLLRSPAQSAAARTRELADLQARHAEMERKVQELRNLSQKIQTAIQNGQQFTNASFLPRRSAFSAMLTSLEKLAVANRLRPEDDTFQQNPSDNQLGLENVEVHLTLEGEYADVVRFINQLEREDLFWIVRDLEVTGGGGPQLRLNLRAETYLNPS